MAAPPHPGIAAPKRAYFVPCAGLTVLDPAWIAADIVRDHCHLICDTLYGTDDAFRPQPQRRTR